MSPFISLFLVVLASSAHLNAANASIKRKELREIPSNTLDRIERLLEDIRDVEKEADRQRVKSEEDDLSEEIKLQSPSKITNQQSVESVREPMSGSDIRHAPPKDKAPKNDVVNTKTSESDKDTKKTEKVPKGEADDKTTSSNSNKAVSGKTTNEALNQKKTDKNTQTNNVDDSTASKVVDKGDLPKETDEDVKANADSTASKVVDKGDLPKETDKDVKVNDAKKAKGKNEEASTKNSNQNSKEKVIDESQEAKDIDEDSVEEMALLKLLEDEMKQKLKSKLKKHPVSSKFVEKPPVEVYADSGSAEIKKESDSAGDYLGDKFDEKEGDKKKAEQTALEQDSELKEFARFRQEVLRKIEKMLVGDVSLALRNGFTVKDIIKDLEKLEHKKENVDQNKMEEDLSGLETILKHQQ